MTDRKTRSPTTGPGGQGGDADEIVEEVRKRSRMSMRSRWPVVNSTKVVNRGIEGTRDGVRRVVGGSWRGRDARLRERGTSERQGWPSTRRDVAMPRRTGRSERGRRRHSRRSRWRCQFVRAKRVRSGRRKAGTRWEVRMGIFRGSRGVWGGWLAGWLDGAVGSSGTVRQACGRPGYLLPLPAL